MSIFHIFPSNGMTSYSFKKTFLNFVFNWKSPDMPTSFLGSKTLNMKNHIPLDN